MYDLFKNDLVVLYVNKFHQMIVKQMDKRKVTSVPKHHSLFILILARMTAILKVYILAVARIACQPSF